MIIDQSTKANSMVIKEQKKKGILSHVYLRLKENIELYITSYSNYL